MIATAREFWRAMRSEPIWVQLLVFGTIAGASLFALFLLYVFITISLFGI